MEITDFLLARIKEVEIDTVQNVAAIGLRNRILLMCMAQRDIIKWHKNWPIFVEKPMTFEQVPSKSIEDVTFRMRQEMAWMTQEEYRNRFGEAPPSAPLLLMMTQPFKNHPDFDPMWTIA